MFWASAPLLELPEWNVSIFSPTLVCGVFISAFFTDKICFHCSTKILPFKFSMHLVTEDSPWRGYATWNDLKMNKLLGDSLFLSFKRPKCHLVVTPLNCKGKKKYLEIWRGGAKLRDKKTSPSVVSVKRRCMLLIFLCQFRIETKRE